MALFEQLPSDVNRLLCASVSNLELDFEELSRLRCVSKAWKVAVEEGSLGTAGPFCKPGLKKFVCRLIGLGEVTYPGLGILSEDWADLYVQPMRQGIYGKFWNQPEEVAPEASWIDIPESFVVINRTLYVLSELRNPPQVLYELGRLKTMRLRSYDLVKRGGWVARSALHFSEEEAPLSPAKECFINGSMKRRVKTTFSVAATERYIFVLHIAASASLSLRGWDRKFKSIHGNIYDSLSDTWSRMQLPEFLYIGNRPRRIERLNSLLCAASGDLVYIKTDEQLFVHPLKAGHLEEPWGRISLEMDGESVRFCSLSMEIRGATDNLILLGWREHHPIRTGVTINTFKVRSDLVQLGQEETLCFPLVDETAANSPTGFGLIVFGLLEEAGMLAVDGELLVSNTVGGIWQQSGKRLRYVMRESADEFSKLYVFWSRFLPMPPMARSDIDRDKPGDFEAATDIRLQGPIAVCAHS
jgi:hypothetical protein